MRTKVTFVLLFLNAALFVFIFRFERDWRTERAAEEVRQRVLGSEAADIRSLEVASDGAVRFRIERRGARWFLTRPLSWPANQVAVNHLLTDLQFLKPLASFTVRDALKNGLPLASYGLDHPKLAVTFTAGGPDTTGSAPITTTLEIGDAAQGGRRLYVLSPDGRTIDVVDRELAGDLTLPLDQLRSDEVFTIPIFEASSLTLRSGGARVHIQRQGPLWSFDTPIPARANKDATELALNGLDSLSVKSFAAAETAAPPSENPRLQATIEGNDRTETLLLGRPAAPAPDGRPAIAPTGGSTDYVAQFEEGETLRPAVFVVSVPDSLMKALLTAREALRERHFVEFDPGSVTTVTLSAPNRPDLILQRLESASAGADAGWQVVVRGASPAGTQTLPADRGAVARLLERLARLSADRFQSDAPQDSDLENWGFHRPEREITLALAPPSDGTSQPVPSPSSVGLQIGLGTVRDGEAYARLTGAPSVYAVNADILAETPVDPLAWRERLLRRLPESAVTGVRITDLSTQAPVLSWQVATEGPPSPAVRRLLDGLLALRARRFTADRFAARAEIAGGESRPWRYRVDVDLSLPGGAAGKTGSTSTLWLTERLAGDLQIAGSRDYGAEFSIEQPLIDALWTLTYGARDPGPIGPPPAAVRSR